MSTSRPLLALGLVIACAASGSAQTFGGKKVVETGVNYPGVGTFTSFTVRPSISGTLTSFGGNPVAGPTVNASLLAMSGVTALVKIADTTTAIPGGSGNFTTFNVAPIGLSGSVYAFLGNGNFGPGNLGDFSNATGSLAPVVNTATAYPTGGTFTGFSAPAVSGTTIAFAGTNFGGPAPPPTGVFTRTGGNPIQTVAASGGAAPGGGTFIDFIDPTNGPTVANISGTNVVFNGRTTAGAVGIYLASPFGIGPVATTTTAVPSATGGTFTSFGIVPAISGSNVAFFGAGSGRSGIYRSVGGTLSRVADTTTLIPGTASPFSSFLQTDVAIAGDRVAFRGTAPSGTGGIYTDLGGSLAKVVAMGDVLDGKTVSAVNIGQFAFEGSTIAVMVGFTNGTGGIYRFSPVPEPAGLLAIGLVGLAAARLRRKRV